MIRRLFEAWYFTIWLVTVAIPGRVLYWLEPLRGFLGYVAFRLGGFAEWCAVRLTDWDWPRPLRYLMWLVAATYDRIDRWFHTRNWQLPKAILFLCWLCGSAFWWIVEWIRTRQLRYFVQGAPAMLVAGFIGLVLFAQAIKPQVRDVERYRVAAQTAMVDEDWEAADVWQRKLLQLGVQDPEERMQMARVAHELGRPQKANRFIDELAPDDRVGYPTAHYWKARSLLESSKEIGDLLVHHLQAALDSPFRVDASVMLGRVYAQRAEPQKAIRLLERVSRARPEVDLILAQLYSQQGDRGPAERHARIAIRHLHEQLDADARDHRVRIALAQALQVARRFREAESVLVQGLKLEPGKRFQDALAALYVAHYDALETGLARLADRMSLVDLALAIAPNHAAALERLAELARDESAARVMNLLLASGGAPATSHILLAFRAAKEETDNVQNLHLRQSQRANRHVAPILNNLAWVFLRSGELDRARLAVSMALRLEPQQAHIHRTRGHVLMQLEQWGEAVDDFKFALTNMESPESAATHAILAEAYERLGDPERAAWHREHAKAKRESPVLEN